MHKKAITGMLVGLSLCVFGKGFIDWQNNGLQITHYDYFSSKLGNDFNGYKIVQISDLHNKLFGENQKKLINSIKKCNPNIIVVTGDMFDENDKNKNSIAFFKEAIKIAPIYYINGNHEKVLLPYTRNYIYNALNLIGVKHLKNEKEEIKIGNSSFQLIGINDEDLDSDVLFDLINGKEFNLLLAHEPQYIDDFVKCDVDLVLSGHAHGGQWRIPFIGGVYAPNQGFFPSYTNGMFSRRNTTMIISRGLGNLTKIPRLNNRPEIVEIEFHNSF